MSVESAIGVYRRKAHQNTRDRPTVLHFPTPSGSKQERHRGSYDSAPPTRIASFDDTRRWEREDSPPHFAHVPRSLCTESAMLRSAGIGPNGSPRHVRSSPEAMTFVPLRTRRETTWTMDESKNWASSIPTTSKPFSIPSASTGSAGKRPPLCETISW